MPSKKEVEKSQLGMAKGTAANKLRKMLLFNLIQRCGLDTCHRCGGKIETLRELSIEHKQAWLHSEDPVGLYFDLDNIAFSHLSCNSKAGGQESARLRYGSTAG